MASGEEAAEGPLTWMLHTGENELEVRGVNAFGRPGRTARLEARLHTGSVVPARVRKRPNSPGIARAPVPRRADNLAPEETASGLRPALAGGTLPVVPWVLEVVFEQVAAGARCRTPRVCPRRSGRGRGWAAGRGSGCGGC